MYRRICNLVEPLGLNRPASAWFTSLTRNTVPGIQNMCESEKLGSSRTVESSPVRAGGRLQPIAERDVPEHSIIVYFDTETTDLNGQLLQIAAKNAGPTGKTFSVYAFPTTEINPRASSVNHLTLVEGRLHYKGDCVEAEPLHVALTRFLEYLESFDRPVVLVAHNAPFDTRHVLGAMANYYFVQRFGGVVVGVCDTLPMFKVNERTKACSCFKQDFLAQQFVEGFKQESAHEAVGDCLTLEALCDAVGIDKSAILENTTPLHALIKKRLEYEERKRESNGYLTPKNPKRLTGEGLPLENSKEDLIHSFENVVKLEPEK